MGETNLTKALIKEKIESLKDHIAQYTRNISIAVANNDFHGASDSANDIREWLAKIQVWDEVLDSIL